MAQTAKDIAPCIRRCTYYVAMPRTDYLFTRMTLLAFFNGKPNAQEARERDLKHLSLSGRGWFVYSRFASESAPLERYDVSPLVGHGLVSPSSRLPFDVPPHPPRGDVETASHVRPRRSG